MIALLLASSIAAHVPPVQLQRTETGHEGAAPFDLTPTDDLRQEEIDACRVEETLLMGSGVAEKRRCTGALDAENARRRCKDADRHNSLPQGVTAESCVDDYKHGRFLFPGELKEIVITRRRDGARIAAFEVLEGYTLAAFQPAGDVVLVGISDGDHAHYAAVSTRGLLRAPPLGDEAVEVSVEHGRIRVTGKARAMQVDLVPHEGELRVDKRH